MSRLLQGAKYLSEYSVAAGDRPYHAQGDYSGGSAIVLMQGECWNGLPSVLK
jgi:hypothetical protein